jgi:hypothetical protein
MAIAVEALTAGAMTNQGVQQAPNVSKDQWTVIGLLLVLLLLEAVVHPTIYNKIKAVIGTFKQGSTSTGKSSNNSNTSKIDPSQYAKF